MSGRQRRGSRSDGGSSPPVTTPARPRAPACPSRRATSSRLENGPLCYSEGGCQRRWRVRRRYARCTGQLRPWRLPVTTATPTRTLELLLSETREDRMHQRGRTTLSGSCGGIPARSPQQWSGNAALSRSGSLRGEDEGIKGLKAERETRFGWRWWGGERTWARQSWWCQWRLVFPLGENERERERDRSWWGSEGVAFPSPSRHGRHCGTPCTRGRATSLSPSDASRPWRPLKFETDSESNPISDWQSKFDTLELPI
jgi:hypothetical protein